MRNRITNVQGAKVTIATRQSRDCVSWFGFNSLESDGFGGQTGASRFVLSLARSSLAYNCANTTATPLLLHAQPWRSFLLCGRF